MRSLHLSAYTGGKTTMSASLFELRRMSKEKTTLNKKKEGKEESKMKLETPRSIRTIICLRPSCFLSFLFTYLSTKREI